MVFRKDLVANQMAGEPEDLQGIVEILSPFRNSMVPSASQRVTSTGSAPSSPATQPRQCDTGALHCTKLS